MLSAIASAIGKMDERRTNGGTKIVLTASRIEMSDFFLNPFIAFTGGFPSKIIPRGVLRKKWYPITPSDENGRARFAPYGLRKIEALLEEEFGEENVVTCTPENLHRFVGLKTKVVGISTMDPLGIGFVSRTYTSLVGFGGEPIAADEFRCLMEHPALRRRNGFKVIVGGSGAWQIIRGGMQENFGIDSVVIGEGERAVAGLFKMAVEGRELPKV
ncbi:MAG: hypothetical protein ACK4GQ_02450, partial [Candidatus Hadarchaeales archaeon]